jgi:pimeloyl-ACP methyl ester carboxylesterase
VSERLTTFTRDGLTFDVRDTGPLDGTPVVLLHGFPQDSRCWDQVAPLLHEHGYRTLAPDQRGYSPGARPPHRTGYRTTELVADIVALIETADLGPVHLVGHDWGAVVAWSVAARHPDLLRTLTAVSVPHPAAFLRSMLTSPQLLKSWYTLAFQLPWLPERELRSRRFERALRSTGQSRGAAARDAALMRQPGAAHAALGWYRAMVLSPSLTAAPKVRVPTLYVWSDGDTAVGPWGGERNPEYVDAAYTHTVLEGVSHWIPDEAPDRLAELLLSQFRA